MHVEFFVTARADRRRVVAACRDLYASARALTERHGGRGPWLYLVERSSRRRRRPATLTSAVHARPNEDVWIEVTFYPDPARRRSILRALWADARIRQKAVPAERHNRKRPRSWFLGIGALRA